MSNVLYYTVGNDLTHHGIKGQKWGQRNGPPYPLGASDHSSAEKKAGTKGWSKEAKQENKKTAAKENNSSEQITTKTKKNESVNTNAKKGLSTKQKVLIGATALVAAYAAYKFVDRGGVARLIQKGKMFVETGKTDGIPWKYNDELASSSMDADEVWKKVAIPINPNYGAPGAMNNCRRCTFSYELRRRGFDVQATRTLAGTGQVYSDAYKASHYGDLSKMIGRTYFDTDTKQLSMELPEYESLFGEKKINGNSVRNFADDTFNNLFKQPNKSRGELTLKWVNASGHSMAWEIINGKPVIFDCQTHNKIESAEELSKYLSYVGGSISEGGITRLDNKYLDADFLLKWCRSV